ncbi:D-tyrosyl-tRNA(Tyr) deacylase [Candidatus Woesebacteria bacterium]|nr:D-tyrosyl-tRNA(Tyr) deacylase [Candidatus Woesebacteria bacterium]
MKLVIQRVKKASVKANQKLVGKIGKGLFVLVGVKKGDSLQDAEALAVKLAKLRAMADEKGKMNLTANEFLVVSQFTLYADTKGGNRPSFMKAALPDEAKKIYEYFVDKLKSGLPPRSPKGRRVETGIFGDYMEITSVLDGPVTIILES